MTTTKKKPNEQVSRAGCCCTRCGHTMVVEITLRVLPEDASIPSGYEMDVSNETGEVSYKSQPFKGEPGEPQTPGQWFRGFREHCDITPEDMARLADTSPADVLAIEQDQDSPYQVPEIFKISKHVGIDSDGLLSAAYVPPSKWGKEKPGWATFLKIQKFSMKAEKVFRQWLNGKRVDVPEMLPKEVLVAVLPYFKDAVKARKRKLKRKKRLKK